jgi:Recombination directionality factor-like
MTEVATREAPPATLRPPIGLLVSTGALVPVQNPRKGGPTHRPAQLSHFRFKGGKDGQYAVAAAKAIEVYGEEPTELDDVLLLGRDIQDVLDIRIVAWVKSGRRITGRTNFATLTREAYALKVDAWDDEILYRPRELSEVPERLREAWQGEPIPSKLEGPEDPRIAQFDMHVEATFRFTLPNVLGMGEVALYSTRSRHNRDQLFYGVGDAFAWFRGRPAGVPFTLKIRPRRTSYFDKRERGWKPSNTFEVVLSSPWTWNEAIEALGEQRAILGSGDRLALPASTGEGPPPIFADNDQRQADEDTDVPAVPVETFDIDPADVREEPDDGDFSFEDLVPEGAREGAQAQMDVDA